MHHTQMPSFGASFKKFYILNTLSTLPPPPCSLAANISHVTLTAIDEFKNKSIRNQAKGT